MNQIKPLSRTRDTVTLSRADYDAMLDAIDETQDRKAVTARLADERRRGVANARADHLPIDLVERLLRGESPIRIWRTHRGMTLDQLARAATKLGATVGRSHLSQIETGRKQGSLLTIKALAKALSVELDDLAG